ncbi:hypothetical protein [Bacillus sp. FJAT-45066]|nr:hypothetical protein [Bacillus sp. FJAT-45066]
MKKLVLATLILTFALVGVNSVSAAPTPGNDIGVTSLPYQH